MILLVNILTLIPALLFIFIPKHLFGSNGIQTFLIFCNIYTTILLAIEPKKPLSTKRFFWYYIIHISTYLIADMLFFSRYYLGLSIVNILIRLVFFNFMFLFFNAFPLLFRYMLFKSSKNILWFDKNNYKSIINFPTV